MDDIDIGLEILKFGNAYAKRVIFWSEDHRKVLRQCLKSYTLLQKTKRTGKTRHSEKKSRRKEKGNKESLASVSHELRLIDSQAFSNLLGLTEDNFNTILKLVQNDLKKSITNFRNTISPEQQLGATLRFLATGDSYQSLSTQTGLSHAFLVYCIPRVCKAISENLTNLYLQFPDTPEQWEAIAEEFENKWQFPLCLGALDGRPIQSNIKGAETLILLALTDANRKFIYIDVGTNSSNNEVLSNSALQTVLDNADNHFPPDQFIGNSRLLPYVIIGNSDVSQEKHLIKPFLRQTNDTERKVYNNRIYSARQVVEQSFGILSARFRVFQKPINLRSISNIELIVRTCCVLHNFAMDNTTQYENIENFHWLTTRKMCVGTMNQSTVFDGIRNEFMHYFNEEEHLEWMEL